MDKETTRLENIALDSVYAVGTNLCMIQYSFEILKRYLRGAVLELGPAEGVMTEKLTLVTDSLTVVEGSKIFADDLKNRFPKAEIHCSLFENFKTNKKFDTIVMGHVLEHVENPVETLKNAKSWLKENGIIFAAVPNSHSIHRQAAVMMELQERENSMSELDIHHGHRRVYSIDEFRHDFTGADLKIKECGGYWLKPVSNKQIEESWTQEMIDAFMKLGEKYPDIAAEIYIVAGL